MKYLLQAAIVLTFAAPSWASDSTSIPCDVAEELAVRAYKRVKQAMAANKEVTAAVASQSFWDIESYAADCPAVSLRAKALSSAGFTKTLKDPLAKGFTGPRPVDPAVTIQKAAAKGSAAVPERSRSKVEPIED